MRKAREANQDLEPVGALIRRLDSIVSRFLPKEGKIGALGFEAR